MSAELRGIAEPSPTASRLRWPPPQVAHRRFGIWDPAESNRRGRDRAADRTILRVNDGGRVIFLLCGCARAERQTCCECKRSRSCRESGVCHFVSPPHADIHVKKRDGSGWSRRCLSPFRWDLTFLDAK